MEENIAYFNTNNGTGKFFGGERERLVITSNANDPLGQLQSFINKNKGEHIVVALSYDLKNSLETLKSTNRDSIEFPQILAWIPELGVDIGDELNLDQLPDAYRSTLEELSTKSSVETPSRSIKFRPTISRDSYLEHVEELKECIQQGTIYEVNFCQEYLADKVNIDQPISYYKQLNNITKAPFSCFLKFDEFQVYSGSPERYISREGNRLISEPIKGTRPRSSSREEDERLKEELKSDPKERSENVMIVDLVRNDFSRIAKKGSVKVDELFGIYSFETVHQMISRIACEVDEMIDFKAIIQATFPMGSMTGAPKISAMKLIEMHESFRRGLYSGTCLLYTSPSPRD